MSHLSFIRHEQSFFAYKLQKGRKERPKQDRRPINMLPFRPTTAWQDAIKQRGPGPEASL